MSALGALVTEFAGIAGAGELFGVPRALTVPLAAVLLVALVVSGGYRRVEVVGIALGLFELAFVGAAVLAHPGLHELAAGVTEAQPLGNGSYLALIAANVGAVVMPWMLFYQQSAVVEKGLGERDLRWARIDTAVGAVADAGDHGRRPRGRRLRACTGAAPARCGASARWRAPSRRFSGRPRAASSSRWGSRGAALVASIVVSLGAAWAVAEAAGRPRSLDDGVRSAPLFYGLFTVAVVLGAALVLSSGSLVRLAVDAEILNALLLPLVLGMLVVLARRVLPGRYALGRGHRVAVGFHHARRHARRDPLGRVRARPLSPARPTGASATMRRCARCVTVSSGRRRPGSSCSPSTRSRCCSSATACGRPPMAATSRCTPPTRTRSCTGGCPTATSISSIRRGRSSRSSCRSRRPTTRRRSRR